MDCTELSKITILEPSKDFQHFLVQTTVTLNRESSYSLWLNFMISDHPNNVPKKFLDKVLILAEHVYYTPLSLSLTNLQIIFPNDGFWVVPKSYHQDSPLKRLILLNKQYAVGLKNGHTCPSPYILVYPLDHGSLSTLKLDSELGHRTCFTDGILAKMTQEKNWKALALWALPYYPHMKKPKQAYLCWKACGPGSSATQVKSYPIPENRADQNWLRRSGSQPKPKESTHVFQFPKQWSVNQINSCCLKPLSFGVVCYSVKAKQPTMRFQIFHFS